MDVVTDANFQESPNIFGDNVVYVEYTTGSIGDYQAIKMKNIWSGIKKTIYESTSSAVQWPSISDKYVVWSEAPVAHVNSVKAADLKTGEVFELQEAGPHQNSHTATSIWNDTAVWMSWRTGNGDVYGATLHDNYKLTIPKLPKSPKIDKILPSPLIVPIVPRFPRNSF